MRPELFHYGNKRDLNCSIYETYQQEIRAVSSDFPFKFIGDFDQILISKFQQNWDIINMLITIWKILTETRSQINSVQITSSLENNISNIIR